MTDTYRKLIDEIHEFTRAPLPDELRAPQSDGVYSEADVAAALSAPFVSPYRKLRTLNAAAKRATLDLTRKLTDLRAGR